MRSSPAYSDKILTALSRLSIGRASLPLQVGFERPFSGSINDRQFLDRPLPLAVPENGHSVVRLPSRSATGGHRPVPTVAPAPNRRWNDVPAGLSRPSVPFSAH